MGDRSAGDGHHLVATRTFVTATNASVTPSSEWLGPPRVASYDEFVP